MTTEVKKFSEEDYIKSFEWQYWPKGHNGHLPEGVQYLLDLADLNGRLVWRGYLPLEPEELKGLPEDVKKAEPIRRLELLKERGMQRPLPVIIVNGRSHP